MSTRTGYYLIKDITENNIHHIYEVTNIERDKSYKMISFKTNDYPICEHNDDLYLQDNNYRFYTEIEIINFIRNIFDGKKNKFRLCENCIRAIIADKQDKLFKSQFYK